MIEVSTLITIVKAAKELTDMYEDSIQTKPEDLKKLELIDMVEAKKQYENIKNNLDEEVLKEKIDTLQKALDAAKEQANESVPVCNMHYSSYYTGKVVGK